MIYHLLCESNSIDRVPCFPSKLLLVSIQPLAPILVFITVCRLVWSMSRALGA